MNGIKEQFAGKLDIVALNIDIPETLPLRQQFDMVGRSTYVLIDAKGNVVQRWFGFLDEQQMTDYIKNYLSSIG